MMQTNDTRAQGERQRCLRQLEAIQELARRQGGRCFAEVYVRKDWMMEFECRHGHRWQTRAMSVLGGSWCPDCRVRSVIGMAAMQALARARGGQCVSETPAARKAGLLWRCAEGHEWSAMPTTVARGKWCPTCKSVEELRTLAAQHGGRCLSQDPAEWVHDGCLQWECAKGHRFAIRRRCVRNGQWCGICRKDEDGWAEILARVDAHAAGHGGRCLSRTRVEGDDPCLEWECAEGHRFAARRRCVAGGQWCLACRDAQGSWHQALARAEEQGGACLSPRVRGNNPRFHWRCAAGHVFTGTAYMVARGTWCPICAGRRLGIEEMRAMAAARGGRCISRKFVDATTKLHWECHKGHRWWADAGALRYRDAWCPRCAEESRPPPKLGDAWNKALARARELGGACVESPTTANGRTPRWRCAKGHEWRSKSAKIAAGLWCSHCSARRLTIEHMQKMAAERDGRCISKKYEGCHTKLQWECEKGHRWWARPTILRQTGCWCPHCAWDRNGERMRSEAKDRR